ncbi:magnesium transporter [Noviherbaspirillum cavernae]|uniref:Magnesium transporter n=1 Tax=Noviherbaspirillum cavernae TaxID=2320862 RepID=A0A418X4F8_9BURK|nr:magnesium transporter CorA family protein [Noviherbaspirillum cavernae]RJG07306.1 magnesium transporter [Noviherbaspirillum cavernae]
MDIFHINNTQVTFTTDVPQEMPAQGFAWLDATHDEVGADPAAWSTAVERATGIHLYDLHLKDATNMAHPSYFDSTQEYAMVVFRKLVLTADADNPGANDDTRIKRKIPPALSKLTTEPVTFLLTERAVVTVHASRSRTIEAMRNRLLELRQKPNGRPPASPAELMLRLLNAMVDQYLELRRPLTTQIDRWQRALLNPRRPFKDWTALLEARIELNKLDHLCEGQHDALQELRDYLVDSDDGEDSGRTKDMLLVRVNDVMEHISRVLNHARRLETSLESAVQIHFSATAHRTNDIMRTLTVITALFMPLTLLTGIFGMNFDYMPLLKDDTGFWVTIGAMLLIVIGMLLFFRSKRYLEDHRHNDD